MPDTTESLPGRACRDAATGGAEFGAYDRTAVEIAHRSVSGKMQAFRPPQRCLHPEQALVSGCDVGRLHRSIRIGRIKAVDESLGHRLRGNQRKPHHIRGADEPGEAVIRVRGVVERWLELAEWGHPLTRIWRGGEPLPEGDRK